MGDKFCPLFFYIILLNIGHPTPLPKPQLLEPIVMGTQGNQREKRTQHNNK